MTGSPTGRIDQIERIHRDSDGTDGTPRVWAKLQDDGIRIGRKRVARLV